MPAHPPRIRIGSSIYHADTCRPVIAAAARGELALHAFARHQYPGTRLPASLLPGLLAVGFWDAHRDQNWGLPTHRNEGLELTFLATGGLAFRAASRPATLAPGDLTITRPWQPHAVGAPHVTAGRLHFLILDLGVRQPHQRWTWPTWLALTPADLRDLTAMLRGNERTVWRAAPEMGDCFAAIGRLVAGGTTAPATGSRLALLIGELLVCLLEILRGRGIARRPALASAERSVAMFLDDLAAHPAEPWTTETMAEHCGLKRTRFAYYCKRLTNRTPVEHLNYLRVAMARRLIRDQPARPLTEIAFACGFSSSQYFATVFRRVEGIAPRRLRDAAAPPPRADRPPAPVGRGAGWSA